MEAAKGLKFKGLGFEGGIGGASFDMVIRICMKLGVDPREL